jgi:hypothetical protein
VSTLSADRAVSPDAGQESAARPVP